MVFKLFILIFLATVASINGFVPAKLITDVINKVDNKFQGNLGKVSESLAHEEITKRGIIQSVVEYFYNQTNGTTKINREKKTNEYYDLTKLYFDYYGKYICNIPVRDMISTIFQPNVAVVDLDSKTKDLPYAHFDAEKFKQSNDRVINFTKEINNNLKQKNYPLARVLTGQVLHTIQDFYSHSNWIEKGNMYLNREIGTDKFDLSSVVLESDENLCNNENCKRIEEDCKSFFFKVLSILFQLIGFGDKFKCPISYFNCSNNIVTDKLVSGYYSGQKLSDGTAVDKPKNLNKCSHGGVLDSSSIYNATGGINKDSGYLLFSPHADFHLKAAELAINHTELFFENIRNNIGDKEFANFLLLEIDNITLSISSSNINICFAQNIKANLKILLVFLIFSLFYSESL